jgi:hypothetical protein
LLNEISGKIQDECRLKPDKIEVIEAGTLDAGVELIEDTRKWQ